MVNQAHTDEPILSSGWWLTASFGSSLCESEYSHPLLSPTITGQLDEVLSALSFMVRSICGLVDVRLICTHHRAERSYVSFIDDGIGCSAARE